METVFFAIEGADEFILMLVLVTTGAVGIAYFKQRLGRKPLFCDFKANKLSKENMNQEWINISPCNSLALFFLNMRIRVKRDEDEIGCKKRSLPGSYMKIMKMIREGSVCGFNGSETFCCLWLLCRFSPFKFVKCFLLFFPCSMIYREECATVKPLSPLFSYQTKAKAFYFTFIMATEIKKNLA